MDMPSHFFVFGLQKSGTKYFKKLLEANTSLKFKTKYVWKHTMNPMDFYDDDVEKFWITKSPYNWATSVIKRHRVDILQKYKRYNLKEDSGMVVRGINVKNLTTLYNHYHTMLINSEMKNVKYEELLNDSFHYFKCLSHNKNYEVKVPPVKNIGTHIDPDVKDQYLTVPRYNDPLVLEINKYIDKDLLLKLNYEVA